MFVAKAQSTDAACVIFPVSTELVIRYGEAGTVDAKYGVHVDKKS